jgi:hypothetical protein
VPSYHAYAPFGVAVTEAVFVSLGREEDYVALKRLGVDERSRVTVARRGGGYHGGVVVARAAEKGAVAVLIATRTAALRGESFFSVAMAIHSPLGGPLPAVRSLWSSTVRRFPTVPMLTSLRLYWFHLISCKKQCICGLEPLED